MDKAHEVKSISISGNTMRMSVDGQVYTINLADHSERLAKASPEHKQRFVVSPSGYGIHWPEIDEDLSIDGLIGVKHTYPLAEAESGR